MKKQPILQEKKNKKDKKCGGLTVIFSDEFYNKCPKCGKTFGMEMSYKFITPHSYKQMFVAFCKKDLILFTPSYEVITEGTTKKPLK